MAKIYQTGDMLAEERYRIDAYLNEGGMQEVYLATDTVFRREVVVKVPKNDSAVKRFKRSAVLSARVTHPNVAKTLDYFEHKDMSHLVEEYLTGGNLSEALMSPLEALDPYLTAKLLTQLARGVAAAHHVDVVHRDLKPNNIMLAGRLEDFTSKITDFGVARMAEESVANAVMGGASSITASKTAIGHLPYMAPELIQSPREVRKPSDIWAIGALTYEMLSGVTPYGEGLAAVPAILRAEPLDLPTHVTRSRQFKELGEEIFEIIKLCMIKDEIHRPTADEVVEKASALCYGDVPRRWGLVTRRQGRKGWVRCDNGEDVFFHSTCVYGPPPTEGDRVLIAPFHGAPDDRGLPVVRCKRDIA